MTTEAPKRSRSEAKPKEEPAEASTGMSADYVGLTDTPEGRAAVGLDTPEQITVRMSHEEPQPLATVPARPVDPTAGVMALANMDEAEFSERLDTLKRGRDRIARIQREIMEQDVDYGLIPGTPKPTLFKSGAEKLALVYGLSARFETTFVPGDGETQPPLKYVTRCFLHAGSFDGPTVAMGEGTANGWEKRYRREADKACPDCGKMAIITSKFEPGWYCFPKKGGCGHKFGPDDERLATQATDSRGDPVAANDLQNTLLKMAEKRAFVDAVLRATASSSLFTQDVAEEPAPTVTSGGAVVDDDGVVVERREDTSPEPEAVHEVIAGVERGGHNEKATGAQVAAVKKWSSSMKLGPYKLADEIADVYGGGLDSTMLDSDEPKEAAKQVLEFLEQSSSVDIGNLITHLKTMAERS